MIQRIHCRACSFWRPATPENIQACGFCHRYAPRPELADALENPDTTFFKRAKTHPDDWCGEAQPARVGLPTEADIPPDTIRDVMDYIDGWPELFISEDAKLSLIGWMKKRLAL